MLQIKPKINLIKDSTSSAIARRYLCPYAHKVKITFRASKQTHDDNKGQQHSKLFRKNHPHCHPIAQHPMLLIFLNRL